MSQDQDQTKPRPEQRTARRLLRDQYGELFGTFSTRGRKAAMADWETLSEAQRQWVMGQLVYVSGRAICEQLDRLEIRLDRLAELLEDPADSANPQDAADQPQADGAPDGRREVTWMDYRCPACGMDAGEPCIKAGLPVEIPHDARLRLLRDGVEPPGPEPLPVRGPRVAPVEDGTHPDPPAPPATAPAAPASPSPAPAKAAPAKAAPARARGRTAQVPPSAEPPATLVTDENGDPVRG